MFQVRRGLPNFLAVCAILIAQTGIAFSVLPAEAETGKTSKSAGQKSPIKIGFLAPLTGVGSQGSADLVNGIKLFLDQEHYKIAGRPIDLIVENDESSPAAAVRKIKKLVEEDKVQILDGLIL